MRKPDISEIQRCREIAYYKPYIIKSRRKYQHFGLREERRKDECKGKLVFLYETKRKPECSLELDKF